MRATPLHENWEFIQTDHEGGFVGYSRAEWLPAIVPGQIHLDLMANGIIPDPFQDMNEMGVQWVDLADWSYRTQFTWQPDPALPRRVLRFESLDTVCTIFLNEEELGKSDNQHLPIEFDVTDLLREGANTLRIDFRSAVAVGEERKKAFLAREALPDDQPYFLERSFVRKAQFMFGWDWGPRLVSCGICGDVKLLEFAGRILDVHYQTRRIAEDQVEITFTSEHEGEGTVQHFCYGNLQGPDGTYIIRWDFDWHPTTFRFPVSSRLMANNQVLDARSHRVGVGAIRLIRQPDKHGESFEFEVNGERVWACGANWIPDHNFSPLVDRARLCDRLDKVKAMGMNMLRVWGGGFYESDEFYDECSERGIMVWQDFPYACAYYPDDEEAQEVARREAEYHVRRLRNYPCLALWCGNNENLEMHENAWMGLEDRPAHYYGANIYREVLPKVVAKLDPDRSYIESSPIGTPPTEDAPDAKRRGPNADGYGDQHNWDVWHGRGDWKHYSDSKGRFSSEYGFASSCNLATWHKTLSKPANYRDSVVRWHDKTKKGYDTFVGYVELHYPESKSLEDWVYYSQLNQRDALRHGIEYYRRSEFCRGSLIWQLNDCWPVQSWAVLDGYGERKALAYDLYRLHDDEVVSLDRQNNLLLVSVCSEYPDKSEGKGTIVASSIITGEIWRTETFTYEVEAHSAVLAAQFDLNGLPAPETIVVASIDRGMDTRSWRLLAEPKQMRWPNPEPVSVHTDGINLFYRTQQPVVDLMFTLDGSTEPFLENCVTHPQAGKYFIQANLTGTPPIRARSLAGEHPIRWTRTRSY
jgi:beta-mannosidase